MIVSKKGCVAALKEAWKRGYEIVMCAGRVAVYTENWALEMDTRGLPLEVSQTLVEHYEGIPVEPVFVQKGKDAQIMVQGELADRRDLLAGNQEEPRLMHRVPVTFRDKWVMFTTSDGEWLCVDQAYLDILEWMDGAEIMMTDTGMALFTDNGDSLTVAPGKFGCDETQKLQQIARIYMEQRIREVEMPENLCLFDDMEREG